MHQNVAFVRGMVTDCVATLRTYCPHGSSRTALPCPPLLCREHVFLGRRGLLRVLDRATGKLTGDVHHSLFGVVALSSRH